MRQFARWIRRTVLRIRHRRQPFIPLRGAQGVVAWRLNLQTGAVEAAEGVEVAGAAEAGASQIGGLSAEYLGRDSVSSDRLARVCAEAGFRVSRGDDGDVTVDADLCEVSIWVNLERDCVRLFSSFEYPNRPSDTDRLSTVNALNQRSLIARFYLADDGDLHAEHDVAISDGLTATHFLATLHAFIAHATVGVSACASGSIDA